MHNWPARQGCKLAMRYDRMQGRKRQTVTEECAAIVGFYSLLMGQICARVLHHHPVSMTFVRRNNAMRVTMPIRTVIHQGLHTTPEPGDQDKNSNKEYCGYMLEKPHL